MTETKRSRRAGKVVEKQGNLVEREAEDGENTRWSAHNLTRVDWLTIRYLVSVEEMGVRAAARLFSIDPTTLRDRMRTEKWRELERIAELPALEELIVMRNQTEILCALRNMSGKLETAMRSGKTEDVELAAKKAELLGKTARTHQSIARASDVSATTMRKVKANAKQPSAAAQDRAAIKAELDSLAGKIPT